MVLERQTATSRIAYRDRAFLDSDDGRPLRILAEYLKPLRMFEELGVRDTIVFFGSARTDSQGPMGTYYSAAQELARRITDGMISESDLELFRYADSPDEAMALLRERLAEEPEAPAPAFARSVCCNADPPADRPITPSPPDSDPLEPPRATRKSPP